MQFEEVNVEFAAEPAGDDRICLGPTRSFVRPYVTTSQIPPVICVSARRAVSVRFGPSRHLDAARARDSQLACLVAKRLKHLWLPGSTQEAGLEPTGSGRIFKGGNCTRIPSHEATLFGIIFIYRYS